MTYCVSTMAISHSLFRLHYKISTAAGRLGRWPCRGLVVGVYCCRLGYLWVSPDFIISQARLVARSNRLDPDRSTWQSKLITGEFMILSYSKLQCVVAIWNTYPQCECFAYVYRVNKALLIRLAYTTPIVHYIQDPTWAFYINAIPVTKCVVRQTVGAMCCVTL